MNVLPDVPFGGPEQTQPGFIQGMIQSLASPFNPAPNPIPTPTGGAPMAPQSVTPPPPSGSTQGGGVMGVLGPVLKYAQDFLIGMGDDTGRYREQMRKQQGARASADALIQVNEAVNAGNVDQADKVIAQAARVVQPEHVPLLQKMMDKVAKARDSQEFTSTLIPSVKMMATGDRPEVMQFLQGAQKVGMDPKLIMQTLNEQFKLTPHFENGMLFMLEPSGGLSKAGPQILPQLAKASEFEKYGKALQQAGYQSPAEFANRLNEHDPQAMADALRLGQAQNAIEQGEKVELEKKTTAIQVAGQIKASGARIGMEESSRKRTFDYEQKNSLLPQEARLYARSVGIDPTKPVGQYSDEEAQRVLKAKQMDDVMKQSMQGYEAARANVEAKPIPETTANRILLNRQVLRGLKTVEANLEDTFVGKGFQGEAGVLWGKIRDTTGKSSESEIFFRRAVNDVGDMLLRARSGAQINEQEYNRLTGLLPQLSDEPTTFRAALKRVIKEVESDIHDRAKLAKQPAGSLSEQDLTDVGEIRKMERSTPTPGGRKIIR